MYGYFLHDSTIYVKRPEEYGGYFTLPANRSYSPIFEIKDGTRKWNISGTNFSKKHVHVRNQFVTRAKWFMMPMSLYSNI